MNTHAAVHFQRGVCVYVYAFKSTITPLYIVGAAAGGHMYVNLIFICLEINMFSYSMNTKNIYHTYRR